jgi:O-antigen ligase
MLIALVATRNITGWIALTVGVIPLVWDLLTTRRIFSWPVAIAIVVLLAGVIATPGARSRGASLVQQARAGDWDSILSYRLAPWAAAADMIRERPILGFGPGTFGAEFVPHRLNAEIRWGRRFVSPQSSSSYAQAHCDYLDALAEIGIPASLAADAAVVTLIIGLAQIVGSTSGRVRHEALMVVAILLIGSVGALAWSTFQQAALAVPILIAAGRGWRLLGADARENVLL